MQVKKETNSPFKQNLIIFSKLAKSLFKISNKDGHYILECYLVDHEKGCFIFRKQGSETDDAENVTITKLKNNPNDENKRAYYNSCLSKARQEIDKLDTDSTNHIMYILSKTVIKLMTKIGDAVFSYPNVYTLNVQVKKHAPMMNGKIFFKTFLLEENNFRWQMGDWICKLEGIEEKEKKFRLSYMQSLLSNKKNEIFANLVPLVDCLTVQGKYLLARKYCAYLNLYKNNHANLDDIDSKILTNVPISAQYYFFSSKVMELKQFNYQTLLPYNRVETSGSSIQLGSVSNNQTEYKFQTNSRFSLSRYEERFPSYPANGIYMTELIQKGNFFISENPRKTIRPNVEDFLDNLLNPVNDIRCVIVVNELIPNDPYFYNYFSEDCEYGQYHVEVIKNENEACYGIRVIQLKITSQNTKQEYILQVLQIKFQFGRQSSLVINDYYGLLHVAQICLTKKVLVHCSNGFGYSAAIIATLLSITNNLIIDNDADKTIQNCNQLISDIRKFRPGAIMTEEQYSFFIQSALYFNEFIRFFYLGERTLFTGILDSLVRNKNMFDSILLQDNRIRIFEKALNNRIFRDHIFYPPLDVIRKFMNVVLSSYHAELSKGIKNSAVRTLCDLLVSEYILYLGKLPMALIKEPLEKAIKKLSEIHELNSKLDNELLSGSSLSSTTSNTNQAAHTKLNNLPLTDIAMKGLMQSCIFKNVHSQKFSMKKRTFEDGEEKQAKFEKKS